MFDKLKDINKLRKMQSELKKELEAIFVNEEKGDIQVVVRGDKRVEKIIIDDEEMKELRDIINTAMKKMDKKIEKQMRGRMQDLGLPGLS